MPEIGLPPGFVAPSAALAPAEVSEGSRGMYLDPRQVPVTLMQPTTDAGQPPPSVPRLLAPPVAPDPHRAAMPHCDSSILHAPSECQHCDHYPDWQELRDLWRINYTGEHDPGKAPCPSEHSRTAEVRDRWPGNRACPA